MSTIKATFRLSPELLVRLKDAAAKSGGKLSQADIVEKALAEYFDGKETIKSLQSVHQDQKTTVTELRAQQQEFSELKEQLAAVLKASSEGRTVVIDAFKQQMNQNHTKVTTQFDSLSSTLHNVTYRLQTLEGALQAKAQPRFPLRAIGFGVAAMVGITIGVVGLWVLRTTGFV
jgi:hypothetical protein